MEKNMDRRTFLMGAGVATLAAGATLTSCAPKSDGNSNSYELAKAGSQSSTEAESIDPSSIAKQMDYDVVVCGAGSCGLNAAAAAAEEGAKVVCLEKCSTSCAGGWNYGFKNTKYLIEKEGLEEDEMELIKKIMIANQGGDPELIQLFVKEQSGVGDWMMEIADEIGHTCEVQFPVPGLRESIVHFDDCYGVMTDYFVSKGGTMVYKAAACQLVTNDSGEVTGVIARDTETGEYTQYNASCGVVLATGGFGSNKDLIRQEAPWCDPDALKDVAPNSMEGGENGDVFALCKPLDALTGVSSEQVHFLGGYYPTEDIFFVDGLGQRFPNNAVMCNNVYPNVRIRAMMDRPGHCVWAVTDSKEGWTEFVDQSSPIAADYESVRATRYDTLDDIAQEFGFDPDTFKASVEEWNKIVADGFDPKYDTDLSTALPLDTPPYHAVAAPGETMAFMGGPRINTKFQVLKKDYSPIEGLFAAGNSCSGYWGPDYMIGVWFGDNKAWAATSGYLAGKQAAANK